MHISKFNINNYKSYFESGDLELNEGINIITGQNNAGKTALLQALGLSFAANHHKSTKTLPTAISRITGGSIANIEFVISKENLSTYIFDHFTQILLPQIKDVAMERLNGQSFFDLFLKEENIIVCTILEGTVTSAQLKGLDIINPKTTTLYNVDKASRTITAKSQTSSPSTFFQIVDLIKQRMYCFQAERMSIGNSIFGENSVLKSNASNLPEVLNILQGDPIRFERYNSYVRKIFPQIFQISTRPFVNNQVQIVVWNEDPILERSDLVVPLSECGTGLGQVLAILYVVLTSDISKVIIIDEPNSFLHPGASRKLIEILKGHPQHQFIIATHSPATIAASNPKTINIVRNKDAQSYIESIDVSEVNNQQLYLAEIGSKLSDVFGADNILWVEGKTEEICFPKIIEKTTDISLMGTTVLSVLNTGDFNRKKDSDLIFGIYEKLSSGKGLLPPAVGFIFDSEKLTSTQKSDLERQSKNKVHFVQRKMFENYLLNPKAIFSVLNNIAEIKDLDLTLEKIEVEYESIKWNKEFISQKFVTAGKNNTDWLINVDGAKFLTKLFSEITANRLTFDKIKHSVALCEWVIENSIEDLKELQDMLKSILSEG